MAGLATSSVGSIRGRTEFVVIYILSGSLTCETKGADVGGLTSTRTTSPPSTLVPSRLGPPSTAPSTECRYGFLWLAPPPLTLTSLPFLPSSLPDLPSRWRLPPGSLPFSFLNGFKKDFRKSMSALYRCRSWRATEMVVGIRLSVGARRAKKIPLAI